MYGSDALYPPKRDEWYDRTTECLPQAFGAPFQRYRSGCRSIGTSHCPNRILSKGEHRLRGIGLMYVLVRKYKKRLDKRTMDERCIRTENPSDIVRNFLFVWMIHGRTHSSSWSNAAAEPIMVASSPCYAQRTCHFWRSERVPSQVQRTEVI